MCSITAYTKSNDPICPATFYRKIKTPNSIRSKKAVFWNSLHGAANCLKKEQPRAEDTSFIRRSVLPTLDLPVVRCAQICQISKLDFKVMCLIYLCILKTIFYEKYKHCLWLLMVANKSLTWTVKNNLIGIATVN